MTAYVYPCTFFSPIILGQNLYISFEAWIDNLKPFLNPKDYRTFDTIFLHFAIENIRLIWGNKNEIFTYGKWDKQTLFESLIHGHGLPIYLYDYMKTYKEDELRLKNFSKLLEDFFKNEINNTNGLIKNWLEAEYKLRVDLANIRSQKFNNINSNNKNLENIDPNLSLVFEKHLNEPKLLAQNLLKIRFDKLNELLGLKTFSLELLHARTIQFILNDQWLRIS